MNSKFKIKNTGDYSPFVKKVINGRDFKACAARESGVYYKA